MKRTVTALEARKRLGEILESVFYRHDEVVIERAGKPMAVVVPMWRYEAMERGRDRIMDLVKMNWEKNEDVPYEEIERVVDQAVRETRGKYTAADQTATGN